ncbi:MAG: hypothetical protein ACUZ9M_02000 [Candidatus Scalindua sp.]
MSKSTSFICEHTAEYVLVPALKQILQKEYEFVTPIFPWMSREGSNISKKTHMDEKFQILGLYPRRPKLANSRRSEILVNINNDIKIGAESALEHGIPVVAGCPLASNLWELGREPDCMWIKLRESTSESYRVDMDAGQVKSICLQHEHVFNTNEDLINYTIDNCNFLSLPEALKAFKDIKMKGNGSKYNHPIAFMGGYKPVYFLMK